MEIYTDGVRVFCLPDGAECLADDDGRNPIDMDECPCGYDTCSGDCAWYAEGMKNELEKILEEIEAEHPYKVPGKPDTYSQYNEGWQDALDRVRGELECAKKEQEK